MYRNRPFVSPLLKRPISSNESDTEVSLEKKARLNVAKPLQNPTPVESPRTPLLNLQVPNYSLTGRETPKEGYFNVLWRNPTTKKNKTWDGDGVLVLEEGFLTLRDSDGKKIASKSWMAGSLDVGDTLKMGNKDVEIDSILSKQDYISGKSFINTSSADAITASKSKSTHFVPLPSIQTIPQFHTALTKPKVDGPRHDPAAPDAIILPPPQMSKGVKAIDVVLDPNIVRHLRPHQREGVRFLYECVMGIKEFNGNGAILADEMGLGKTLTVIALIWTLLKQSPIPGERAVVKKVLVVCPVTLINNWKTEFRKWLGNERIGVLAVDPNTDLRGFIHGKTYQVMLINYEKVVKITGELNKMGFDLVICDEGHRLKTQGNKSAQAIKSLLTPRRILLTGTPIQNDLGEFFTMVDFVNPGLLDTYQKFKKVYETPIVKARQPKASKADVELGKGRSLALSKLTGMFVLRRTSEILSSYLPTKHEYVVFCAPTSLQKRVYKAVLESPAIRDCLYNGDSGSHLKAITLMRKICNAVSLVTSKAEQETDDPLYSVLNASILPPKGKQIPPRLDSGKLTVLENLLQSLRTTSREKIVLVSNFTRTLDIVQTLLQSHNMTFCRLDGTTDSSKRQQIVDQFNRVDANTCFAFLLSSKSGGCGLNLVGASRLVLFDVDWNPSNDLQSMARIHRDGQTRNVHIYRFLTTGMMDEKIYQRQITKQGLADSFMDGKGSSGNSFSLEELKNLFSYRESACDTHDLLDCPCNGNGVVVEKELLTKEHETPDDEQELGFLPASQLKDEPKKKHKFDALHEFWHFDPQRYKDNDDDNNFLCDIIHDDVLRKVVETYLSNDKPCSISYLFGVKRGN